MSPALERPVVLARLAAYKRLVAAVVRQALDDHQANLKQHGITAALLMEPARWLLADTQLVFSFEWCCNVLDLDPGGIRARMNTRDLIKKMRETRVRQEKYESARMRGRSEE